MEIKKAIPTDAERIMDFAAELGVEVLIRGGEIWRVEEVIYDLFRTYGLDDGGIFVLPHTLIISARGENRAPVIRQKNVGNIVVNMEELSRLNRLVRTIHSEKPAAIELKGMLQEAVKGPHYPRTVIVLGMVLALLSLNFLIGGGWREAVLIAAGITVVMGGDLYLAPFPGTNKMLVTAMGSLFIGIIDVLACRAGFLPNPYHVMVVTAIGLVPGIHLINSCRELLCGHVLCGSLLFMQAFMEVLAVVCGFAIALALFF